MQKYDLCIIDDSIPIEQFMNKIEISDTNIIDQNIFNNYIKLAEEIRWADINLYNLVKNLNEQEEYKFNISGFKAHAIYLNYVDEYLFSPDIIIFDWDIGASDKQPEESLNDILEKTYCLIAIYSGCDKIEQITAILNEEKFKSFNNRIFIIDKNEQESDKIVINKIKENISNFSFQYGKIFKHDINIAINTTFCKIGKLSFNQFVKLFGECDNNKYEISSLDFIDIMSEQIKAHLVSSNRIKSLNASEPIDDIVDEKYLWYFRMFHEPKDNMVRKGDIIRHRKENKYYLIISSDCHLRDFWKKNVGLIAMVPIYKADDPRIIKDLREHQRKSNLSKYTISSLTNSRITSITMLPFMDKKDDYIVMLKNIKTIKISLPEDYKTDEEYPLKYDEMPNFKGENRLRLNEPFLSSLIELILRNITGIGVPDYSVTIQETLKNHISSIVVNEGKSEAK